MNFATLFGAMLIVGLAFVFGCSAPESRLTGKWFEEGKHDTKHYIEFFSDKTVAMKADMPLSGTWTILNDGRIKAGFDVPLAGKQFFLGELKAKHLIMDINGEKGIFVKVEQVQPSDRRDDDRKLVRVDVTTSQRDTCINNLRQIESAKEQLALARMKATGESVVPMEVDAYMKTTPTCPSGGTYTYNPVGSDATCTILSHHL